MGKLVQIFWKFSFLLKKRSVVVFNTITINIRMGTNRISNIFSNRIVLHETNRIRKQCFSPMYTISYIPFPQHPFHHHPSYRGGEHDRLLIDWLVSHTRWLARFLCKSKIFWSASIHHINSETILRSRISGDQPTQNWLESICQTNIISHKKSA